MTDDKKISHEEFGALMRPIVDKLVSKYGHKKALEILRKELALIGVTIEEEKPS